jgi:hypothetical protein
MKFVSGVQFSAKELHDLVAVCVACVRVERRVRHIALLPNCLGDLKSAINRTLNSYQTISTLGIYNMHCSLNGFILGYKNVKIIADIATIIIYDDSYMHLDIEAHYEEESQYA